MTGDCRSETCDDPGQAATRHCVKLCGDDRDCHKQCLDDSALEHCAMRRADAIESAQRGFTRDHIRWACADVSGVNTNGMDSRGAEYCEYYAVVQPPPTAGGDLPAPAERGRPTSGDGLSLELDDEQVFALEDEPDAVVGQCIFTSWFRDQQRPLPVCDSAGDCATLQLPPDATRASWTDSPDLALRLDAEHVRMSGVTNSGGAAASLFRDCFVDPPAGDPADQADPLHDDFTRGCWKAYELFRTEWRRSDSSVCVVGVRMNECGCGVDTDSDGIPDVTDPGLIAQMAIPDDTRGFHLGTWLDSHQLPAGCRHVDTGEDSDPRTLVSCDLTSSDVLAGAQDLKGRCQQKYGDNVVVHVPVPASKVVCEPPEDGQYSASCTNPPWMID